MPSPKAREPFIKPIRYPIWTENKARLIERYLYYFVLITKHGTYIDCFAGPQESDKPDMWAAKLVLESKPRWLRHFHLFELDPASVKQLEDLRTIQPARNKKKEPKREIKIYPGDCNREIDKLLASKPIRPQEATFCLLDQRTFECEWATVAKLAKHKREGSKIELFYFYPEGWLARSLSALKDTSTLEAWWGRPDWQDFKALKSGKKIEAFMARFKDELGYWSVKNWPIYAREDGGRIMYHMIHATDHPAAPGLMARAYEKAVLPREPQTQLELEFSIR
ncbi:MAG: three-Cys-motif partner protein TcmP [Thermoanaerobaculia bacterium]|nr:three-Cys-motif partner protein TcmP [Myxococcota bacterium]MCK6682671.1 three-Cys-motif partner protein TcmP [Thermoanaerobaculia bacterium]